MNPFEKNQKIEEELHRAISKTFIPVDADMATVYGIVRNNIKKVSLRDLGLSVSGYNELIHPSRKEEMRMGVAGAIINQIGSNSPGHFGEDEYWYATTLELQQSLAKKWNVIRESLRNEIAQKIGTQAKIMSGSPLAKA
jgi:hypothetical protein